MSKFFKKHRSEFVFIGLILGGVFLRVFLRLAAEFVPSWLDTLIHTLGDALMVAGLLGWPVDFLLKRDLIHDVGPTLLGWDMPDEIKNHLRETIRTTIVRRRYRASYVFRKADDKLVLDVEEGFEVFNYGPSSHKYGPHFGAIRSEEPLVERLDFFVNGKEPKVYDGSKLEKCLTKKANVTELSYAVPAVNLAAQDARDVNTVPACRVKWTYRITKRLDDFILSHSPWPTIGMTVSIRQEQGCDLVFEFDDDMDHADGGTEWSTPDLFVPQRQLSFRWHPRNSSA